VSQALARECGACFINLKASTVLSKWCVRPVAAHVQQPPLPSEAGRRVGSKASSVYAFLEGSQCEAVARSSLRPQQSFGQALRCCKAAGCRSELALPGRLLVQVWRH
jgi:hypothetical protein